MVVQSGEVVTNPDESHVGTFLKLILANSTNDTIYIPVDSLIEYVTSGSQENDTIIISISDDHKVTANISNGSIEKEKLSIAIQNALNSIDNKVDKENGKSLSKNDFTDELKNKLENIEAKANNYQHPSYDSIEEGFYKITADSLGHISKVTKVEKIDITNLGIPAQDTTYENATSESNGLMSAADKNKLDSYTVATEEEVQDMLTKVFDN